MAGGKGTRLRPLTCHVPKPMVPLLNRPCMEYNIELLKRYGITDIAVTVQYLPEVIRNYFGDGAEFGVKLRYFEETEPLGTAGSVKNAEDFLDEPFIVISGDALTDFDLQKAIAFHRRKRSIATIVLTRVPSPLEFGVVMTEDDGRIVRFLEKPSWSEVFSDTVNTGIYILEPQLLQDIARGTVFDFSNDLFPMLLRRGAPLFGYVAEGYWSDIGNLQQYRQTQFDMLDKKVNVRIAASEVLPGIYMEERVKLPSRVKCVGPAYIGSGTIVEDDALIGEYTVLGKHNIVAAGTAIQRSILWDGNRIAAGCELQGTSLCGQTRLAPNTTLHEGSVIGMGCTTGPKSIIRPGVKIWPKKHVQAGATVHTSLIWGEQAASALFGSIGVQGTANIDMTPDFAGKLAAAYGSLLPRGGRIAVSASPAPFAQLIKTAFASGLHSAGIHTTDLGLADMAVSRYTVKSLRLDGGIHIRFVPQGDETKLVIAFMDRRGLPLAKNEERKIENAYWQEDFVRSRLEGIGVNLAYAETAENDYLQALAAAFDLDAIRTARFSIVIQRDADEHDTSLLLRWLRLLGTSVVTVPSDGLPLHQMADLAASIGADLAVRIDASGGPMTLYTGRGDAVADDLLLALKTAVSFRSGRHAVLGVPVSAPQIIETIAAASGASVIRTKETPRAMMEVNADATFSPLFDDLYALGAIFEAMAAEQLTFTALLEQIPQFCIAKEEVPCPWSEKGRIMRLMMGETKDRTVELTDGIKIFSDDGWVLILPDSDGPTFKLVAQSKTMQSARTMIASYSERILNSTIR